MEVGGSCCSHGDAHQPVIKVPETGSQGEEEGLGRNWNLARHQKESLG